MKKIIFPLLLSILFYNNCDAQYFVDFAIPFPIGNNPGKDMVGYYHAGNNQIVINVQTKTGITHFLYDTSFSLLGSYDYETQNRQLSKSSKKGFFLRNICLGNQFIELYAENNTLVFYRLDFLAKKDLNIARIGLRNKYEDERLISVMPSEHGCNFLSYSENNKKIILYKWEPVSNTTVIIEGDLPKSTLSKEEAKEKGDFAGIKTHLLFQDLSVSCIKPNVFQFPAPGQLFYTDSCIYIVHKIPYQLGINVFKIDMASAKVNSKNYFINKYQDGQLKFKKTPVATLYDSLLIIQNSSADIFEYYFFNIVSGTMVVKYETKTNDKIYDIVHSPLRQIGTFRSAKEEVELSNEKNFIRKKNSGLSFIKPLVRNDSLILTFGSFIATPGIEGTLLAVATGGFASMTGIGIAIGEFQFIPYLTSSRNNFLYAHSQFSLNGLKPSKDDRVSTYLDAVIADKKLNELEKDNSLIIDLGQSLYICIYNKATKTFKVSKY